MLILTPTPLETDAERAFFAELAGWDTGGAVRGAVVASLPVVDGPVQRRQADAVLFVPEGIAVVRVVEVVRQSGVVTALPDGAWTIGPGAGPGDVLQLAGGGSTPLEGLMRAGMDAAVRLRKAGLEPGRIARLTVLTGDVTGLLPADGDLGDGDQVALLEPRSLLLGVARASRYAGTDNPRLWTTADVRSGIEALGVAGRTPSVEELNGEGFPYSPYVLRRRELLVPMSLPSARGAAMSWSSDGPAGPTATPATATSTSPVARRAGADGPLVDPAAAGRVAAAAVQAQEAAGSPAPAAERPDGGPGRAPVAGAGPATASATSTVTVTAPAPAPPAAGGGSTAFLPAGSPPGNATASLPAAPARDTVTLSAGPGAAEAPAAVAGPRTAPDGSGGLGDLFGDTGSGHLPPSGDAAGPVAAPGRRPRALLVAAALLVVVLAGIGGFLLLRDPDPGSGSTPTAAATGSPAAPSRSDDPTPGDTEVVDGVTFTLRTGQVDGTCRGHAYGSVAGYFDRADCVGLSRALWSAQVEGGWTVVSLARVVMPDEASARALQQLADTDGSGNVSDLLREGVRVDGAPERLSGAQYDSALDGVTVTIVETAWADGAARGNAAVLDGLAGTALALPSATVPTRPVD
ncbi:hypothetical protein [Modestobacter sp. URMC 112]